jgi:predicted nucleic acid-binding protein
MESSQAILAQKEQVKDLAPKLLMEEVRKRKKKVMKRNVPDTSTSLP